MLKKLRDAWLVFDTWLIDSCFQPFSDWFRNKTGRSNFWIAKWILRAVFIDLALGLLVVGNALYRELTSDVFEMYDATIFLVGLVGLTAISIPVIPALFKATTALDMHGESIDDLFEASQTMNHARVEFEGTRFQWSGYVCFCIPLAVEWIWFALPMSAFILSVTGLFVGTLLTLYFFACTPRPRKKQFVRREVHA